MYTILETGGKQYRVGVGDLIDVELLDAAQGSTVNFDRCCCSSARIRP
jgi:large subunit ribosomal protein L21